jgi:RHS repeat-associated protein
MKYFNTAFNLILSILLLSLPTGAFADTPPYVVGQIPYETGTTPSGGFTVSIPISTLPSPGTVPSISLVYNSQSGEGLAGYGWDIAGLSAITLDAKNQYFDGTVAAPDPSLPNSQVFSLDGSRLVNGNEEMDGYPLVTVSGDIWACAHRVGGGHVSHFTTICPDHSQRAYGFADTARTKLTYPIRTTQDARGYKVRYNYTFRKNRYYIKSIEYGGKSENALPYKLCFGYSPRTRSVSGYVSGNEVRLDSTLTYIQSFNGDQLLGTYILSHHHINGRTLLAQVDYESFSGEKLPPLTFRYGTDGNQIQQQLVKEKQMTLTDMLSPMGNAGVAHVRGHFLKDSYSDGMLAFLNYPTYTVEENDGINRYFSPYPSSQLIQVYPTLDNTLYQAFTAGDGFQTISSADVDGDGRDEVVKVNFGTFDEDDSKLNVTVYSFTSVSYTSRSFSVDVYGKIACPDPNHPDEPVYSPMSRNYYFGDFLGNGKTQLLTVSHQADLSQLFFQTPHFALIDLENGTLLCDTPANNLLIRDNTLERFNVMDMDGDGKAEFHDFLTGDVYSFGNNSFTLSSGNHSLSEAVLFNPHLILGDINADGLLDFIVPPAYSQEVYPPNSAYEWTVYTNTGRDFKSRTMASFRVGQFDRFQLMDVNRDGYMDLFRFSGNEVSVHVNDGGSFRSTYLGIPLQFGSSSLRFLDITQLNAFKASHVVIIEDNLVSTLSLGTPDEALLTGIHDSFGNQTKCTYSTAYNADGPYSPTSTARTYPLSQRQLPVPLLAGVKKYMDGDTTAVQNQSYRYAGSVVALDRPGFISFDRTEVTDSLRDWTSTTHFDPLKRGTPTSSLSPASEFWYNYTVQTGSDKREKVLLSWTGNNDIATDLYTYRQFTYDNYGYPTRESGWECWYSDMEDILEPDRMYLKQFEYDHETDTDYYRLGLLTSSETKTWFYDTPEDCPSQRTEIQYDDASYTYNPLRKKVYVGNDAISLSDYTLESDTKWTYDSHSNITSERTASYGATEYVGPSYTYGSNGRTLVSSTDELGRSTTYAGYDRFLHPASATDNHNRATVYSYDSFGKLTATAHPDGSVDSTTVAWGGAGKYTVMETVTAGTPRITHYDALGREIRTSEKTFDNLWRSVDVQYDSLGRKWRTSLPFRGAQPALWNEVAYDSFDRQARVQEASGRVSTWVYGLHSVTQTIDGVTTVRQTSPSGRYVTVTDAGGTVSTGHDAEGKVSYSTVSGGGTTSIEYDVFGRRTRIDDPSDGVRTTAYDDYANGTSRVVEINSKGMVTTYRDKYGRTTRTERTGTGTFSTDYTYNADNQLLSERSSNGTSSTFQYDTLGRVISVRDSVPDGKWLQKEYTYGPGSRIANIAYTAQSGFIDREVFTYANGHNTAVRLSDSTVVWALTAENDLGLATQGVTGPVTRTYGFTPTGLPTSRSMTCAQTTLQLFTYQFDPATGNLLSRQDAVHNQAETFGYDGLNRLTSAGSRQAAYASNGNVRSIDGAGTMTYTNPAKPYTLTSFNPAGGVDFHDYSASYSAFDRPNVLNEDSMSAVFTYDAAHDRVRMDITNDGDPVLVRYYIGGRYELDVTEDDETERLYIGGDAYSAPAVLIHDYGDDAWCIHYIGRDYLGSITHITDADGDLVAEYSYDPWGRLRDPGTLVISGSSSSPVLLLGRGFTGHEHLPWFGLVNMNARLYDPLLGRFLAPDPFVQDPESTQNFNRYSYALNNPLKYTDESGEFVFSSFLGPLGVILDRACWGGLINGTLYTFGALINREFSWGDLGLAILSGAINGALSSTSVSISLGRNISLAFSISPQISFGSDGMGIGLNAGLGLSFFKSVNLGINAGASYFASATGTGNSGLEGRLGYGLGYKGEHFQAGVGSTYFMSDETTQLTGNFYVGGGQWRATYENDTWVPVPGLWKAGGPERDKFRTAALRFDITGGHLKGAQAGLYIFTGKPKEKYEYPDFKEDSKPYRLGTLYLGYHNYRIGYNSEKNVRGPIQNGFHDLFHYPHFAVLSIPDKLYYGLYTSTPFTVW